MSTLQRLGRVHIAPDGFTSSFCRLQNGELLVSYSSPSGDGNFQVNLVRSDDGGRTWSDPHTLLQAEGETMATHIGTSQLADGSIILPFNCYNKDQHSNRSAGIIRSTDNGQTWEPPRPIMDMGEFGGKPQKENGCSDPNILVDRKTGLLASLNGIKDHS